MNNFNQNNQDPFKEFFNNFLKNLTEKQKTLFSFLVGWIIIQLIFLLFTEKKNYWENIDYFWPFESVDLKWYGFFEFTIYAIVPIIVFGVNHEINKKKDLK